LKELLSRLVALPGISGEEHRVAQFMEEELTGRVSEIRRDKLGNLIAQKGEGKPHIMLAAHMDEIGFRVKYINEKGFIRFVKVGGIDDRTLLNQRVTIYGRKEVKGVIGAKPPHLQKEEERKKVVEASDMFIDVGASEASEVEQIGIRVGDFAVFDSQFSELAGDMVKGKAFDNRVGCAVLIQVLEGFRGKGTLYGVGTVQEEVGLKGARTAAYALKPDIAIALDTTTSGDTPGLKEGEATASLGKGPAITVVEAGGRGLIAHQGVVDWLKEAAERENIPYQMEVGEGGMTDSAVMYITREGVPCGTISIPTRYIHGPGEVLNIKDAEYAVKLLLAALSEPPHIS
jgi:endoglucanase